jgi:hypothetical protein
VKTRREMPIGLFGAGLVVVLAPLAFGVQVALGKILWTPELFAIGFPIALVVYYVAWKFIVGWLNDLLGIG